MILREMSGRVVAQHLQRAADLAHRLVGAGADHSGLMPYLLGGEPLAVLQRPGMEGDEREPVADFVVDLPRDPDAFLRAGLLGGEATVAASRSATSRRLRRVLSEATASSHGATSKTEKPAVAQRSRAMVTGARSRRPTRTIEVRPRRTSSRSSSGEMPGSIVMTSTQTTTPEARPISAVRGSCQRWRRRRPRAVTASGLSTGPAPRVDRKDDADLVLSTAGRLLSGRCGRRRAGEGWNQAFFDDH
ncbi:hypothetical protein GCM10027060_22700 [Nesterenkonia halophila]